MKYKKKKRKYKKPRVPKEKIYNREKIVDLIKEDFKKQIDSYHLSLLNLGASYSEVEYLIINEIFRHIANSYGMDLIYMKSEKTK